MEGIRKDEKMIERWHATRQVNKKNPVEVKKLANQKKGKLKEHETGDKQERVQHEGMHKTRQDT